MKKEKFFLFLKYLFIFLLLAIILFSIMLNPNYLFDEIISTLKVWLNKVFPSVFTFYIISSFMIDYGVWDKIMFCFKPLKRLFKFDSITSLNLFFISMLVGSPTSSKLIINSLDNNSITKTDASTLIKCSSFISPLFIISFFSFNLKYAFIILLVHILSNVAICFFLTKKKKNKIIKKESIEFALKQNNFFDSIPKAMNLLLMIAGTMVVATIIRFAVNNFFTSFSINSLFINLLLSLLEISTGLNYIQSQNLDINFLIFFSSFLISFNGIAIHLQVYSIIKNKIEYQSYFIFRILQGIFSSVLSIIIINIL